MRLATFEHQGREQFGIVIEDPNTGTDWVFAPDRVEAMLERCGFSITGGYYANRPRFLDTLNWPQDLTGLLALGEPGLSAARRLRGFLRRYLEQGDQWLMAQTGAPLASVTLRAPIPRPRLLWGLVQNAPTFARNTPERTHINLYPQGHQRGRNTVVGHGQPVVFAPEHLPFGYNVELGVIIGCGGRYIPIEEAMAHVAGYTVILDICGQQFSGPGAERLAPEQWTFYDGLMTSWGGKNSDTMCGMGPFLVTREEVGNPYDLLVYTRTSGLLRDRSHTAAMLLGIERTIHWYSQFATLYPGDVIHLATMGTDGMGTMEDTRFGPDDFLELEIEQVGVLRHPVVITGPDTDWRPPQDPGRDLHPAPAVRDCLAADNTGRTAPTAWAPDTVRHLWTAMGNYAAVEEAEGVPRASFPRAGNGPASALGCSGSRVEIPPETGRLSIGPELAFVVRRVAARVTAAEANDYILGYLPVLAVADRDMDRDVLEPATMQERWLPRLSGRWPDGFVVVPPHPQAAPWEDVADLELECALDHVGTVRGKVSEYVFSAPEVLCWLTRAITLFPGDVVALGRLRERLQVPATQGIQPAAVAEVRAGALGTVTCRFDDWRHSAGIHSGAEWEARLAARPDALPRRPWKHSALRL